MKKDTNLSSHKCYTQWFIRDAKQNVLSIYKTRNDSMWWMESDIYGSSRVGVYYPDSLIYPKSNQVIANDTFNKLTSRINLSLPSFNPKICSSACKMMESFSLASTEKNLR